MATSDREVNLKILLALAIEEGRLDPAERDELPGPFGRAEVADEVLRQVDHSVAAFSRAVPGSARELDAYEALLDTLEDAGPARPGRGVPADPGRAADPPAAGAGLIRPELAVLLAYAKSDLVAAIEASPTWSTNRRCSTPSCRTFPAPIREPFEDLIPGTACTRSWLATDLAGELVDQLGIVWAHETAAELGRGLAEVAAAFWAARQVIGAG